MKILIVDDDAMNIKVLEGILLDNGYDVITAFDGQQAFDKLENNPEIGVVLLDRMMPNMGGMEVMHKMKNDPRWSKLPVIMQTAANSPKDVIDGTSSGVYYYLTKPFEEKILLSILRAAIDESRR